MSIFDEQYKAFAERVIPEEARDNQRRDMKMSFYSGALCLVTCFKFLYNENGNQMPDKEFDSLINDIYNKMEEFLIE